jgi:hypothetical protein
VGLIDLEVLRLVAAAGIETVAMNVGLRTLKYGSPSNVTCIRVYNHVLEHRVGV